MATMRDVSKLRFDHVLDLRDWNLESGARSSGALDLRIDVLERTENFFESMPSYANDSFLTVSEVPLKIPVAAEAEVNRARFMIKLAVVLTAALLVSLIVAMVAVARTLIL